jgi:hypothetical protein
MDAVEFCRALSGRRTAPEHRGDGTGDRLVATPVPF